MFGAFNYAATVKEGYLSSRTFQVISVKSGVGDVAVDLFFDTLSENDAHLTWKQCIQDAVDSATAQLTPLKLAQQRIGLDHRAPQLRKAKTHT